jgi:hypothetical protein
MATNFVGAPSNLVGAAIGSISIQPGIFLDGASLGANAAAFPLLTFPAFNSLDIRLNITGLSGSDTLILRFNADAGANYWDRNLTVAAGAVVVVDTNTTTANQIKVAIATTKSITGRLTVTNSLAVSKLVSGAVSMGTGAVGTAGTGVISMAGEWINTTAQITSLSVLLLGANNILAGSSVQVFGGI